MSTLHSELSLNPGVSGLCGEKDSPISAMLCFSSTSLSSSLLPPISWHLSFSLIRDLHDEFFSPSMEINKKVMWPLFFVHYEEELWDVSHCINALKTRMLLPVACLSFCLWFYLSICLSHSCYRSISFSLSLMFYLSIILSFSLSAISSLYLKDLIITVLQVF